MRTALWFLGLFAAAVAIALVAISNAGTVSIFLPTRRIDLSLNLALMALALLFVLLHTAINALRKLITLPARARQWRSLQRERGAHAALLDAWIYWRAGRYVRARDAAQLALAREQAMRDAGEPLQHAAAMQALARTVLAESAQALREPDERDAQLAQGLAISREGVGTHLLVEAQHGLMLRAAQWAVAERHPERAQQLLQGLARGARRRAAALRLRARVAELAGRPLEAFELTRLLRKHGDYADAASLRRMLPLAEAAATNATSLKALRAIWSQSVEGTAAAVEAAGDADLQRLRLQTGLALVSRTLALQGIAQADEWLRVLWNEALQRMDPAGDPATEAAAMADWAALIPTLESLIVALDGQPGQAGWLDRMVQAQQQHPQHAPLQYLAGMVALSRSSWAEARRLLALAVPSLPTPRLQRQAWRALARLAESQGRMDEAQQAWQQAASID